LILSGCYMVASISPASLRTESILDGNATLSVVEL
jgi:hypothetical protein